MIKDLAFVAYPAKDVRKLIAFYRDVLGLTLTREIEDEGELQAGEFTVGSSYFYVITHEWVNREPGSASGVAFEVDDVEGWLKTLEDRGATVGKIHENRACLVSILLDPEGNKITFHQTTSPS